MAAAATAGNDVLLADGLREFAGIRCPDHDRHSRRDFFDPRRLQALNCRGGKTSAASARHRGRSRDGQQATVGTCPSAKSRACRARGFRR